jgi:hypothetical protein
LKPGGFKLWVNCIQLVHTPTVNRRADGLAASVLVLVRRVDASDGFASDQMLWATKETAHLVLVRPSLSRPSLSLCTLSDGF